MHDDELRDAFAAWARRLTAAVPPSVPAIRRRARLRTARITVSCVAALAVIGAGTFSASKVLGTGQPAPSGPASSSTPAGHSQHAGQAGPNPRYARAPYYIAVGSNPSVAGVWDAVTGTLIGTLRAPEAGPAGHRYRQIFAYISAAADDQTFVLAAVPGDGSNVARPVGIYEVRLNAGGTPGPLQPLNFTRSPQGIIRHWNLAISALALSPDGSRLAIATDRNWGDTNGPPSLEVVTLATGATRTWTARPQDISSLSWGGDRTVAFACDGVCLLNTRAAGNRLTKADIVIPWSRTYRGMQGLQWPMITPNGADIYVAMEGGGLAIVEFSARTGQPLQVVLGPRPTDGALCGTLWSDPSGRHLVATCSWGQVTGTISGGRFHWGHNLPPSSLGDATNGAGGYIIGW